MADTLIDPRFPLVGSWQSHNNGYPDGNRLVGLVVKVFAWRAADPGFDSRLRRGFFLVKSYHLKPCFTNPCAAVDSRSRAPCTVCIGWSVAVDPLSATAVPLHLTQFAVPFVQIVATVCLQGT